jgi:hypothetical protein
MRVGDVRGRAWIVASSALALALACTLLLLGGCGADPTQTENPTPTAGAGVPTVTRAPASPDGLLADLSRAIKAVFDR